MGILSRLKREERAREAALRVPDRTSHMSVAIVPPLEPVPDQSRLPPLTFDLSECYSENDASAAGFSLKKYNEELDQMATAAIQFTRHEPKLARKKEEKS